MAIHAYIKLVEESQQKTISLEEVKDLLRYYRENVTKTGQQLSWQYGRAAFPYEFAETREGKGKWFYLKATEHDYHYIVLGVDQEETENEEGEKTYYIQVTLPADATHGDKSKANELCKYMAGKLKAQLHLFNGRVMYYYDLKG